MPRIVIKVTSDMYDVQFVEGIEELVDFIRNSEFEAMTAGRADDIDFTLIAHGKERDGRDEVGGLF